MGWDFIGKLTIKPAWWVFLSILCTASGIYDMAMTCVGVGGILIKLGEHP